MLKSRINNWNKNVRIIERNNYLNEYENENENGLRLEAKCPIAIVAIITD